MAGSASPSARGRDARRALVLADSDVLYEVIRINLEVMGLGVTRAGRRPPGGSALEGSGDLGLIVVALGASQAEPMVVLRQASLLDHVGQTPLLIVSNRPCGSDAERQVSCLDFPFDADELWRAVSSLSRGAPR